MTRNVKSIEGIFKKGVAVKDLRLVHADASKYPDLVAAMTGVDIAFYLIHSMEGSSKDWKRFADRDRTNTILSGGINDPILPVAFILLIPVVTSYILMIVKYRHEAPRSQ